MWKYPQDSLPADGDTVWVTRLPYFDKPWQAVYNLTDNTFQFTDANGNAWNLNPWLIWKWRPV
jgi:hypothetical protein